MNNIKDLEILSKYLSEDELKEIAKDVAREKFRSSLGKDNPHAKSNLDYYIGKGAFEAVKEYGEEIDFDFHAAELKEKVSKIIRSLQSYNLPSTYTELAKKYIEDNKEVIDNKMQELMDNFVNGENWSSAYGTFSEYIGERMADMLYSAMEEKFKK